MNFAAESKVEGDYLEFGVYEGSSFVPAYHFAKKNGLKAMKFYAFDSFEGLPDMTGNDAEGFCQWQKGDFACSPNGFEGFISGRGVKLKDVELIPGYYSKTLNEETKKNLPLEKAAVILINADLYESAKLSLDFITDYVRDGTILILAGWFSFRANPYKGEQRAFREWLKKNPSMKAVEYHKFGWGNSFIMHLEK